LGIDEAHFTFASYRKTTGYAQKISVSFFCSFLFMYAGIYAGKQVFYSGFSLELSFSANGDRAGTFGFQSSCPFAKEQ
jgi:hypothetical protein